MADVGGTLRAAHDDGSIYVHQIERMVKKVLRILVVEYFKLLREALHDEGTTTLSIWYVRRSSRAPGSSWIAMSVQRLLGLASVRHGGELDINPRFVETSLDLP